MIGAFLTGLAAGYGVAIPVGAIAVLIIDTSVRRGLRIGLAAGAGAATADGLYALLAAVGGLAIANVVEPIAPSLRMISATVLVAIAVRGLVQVTRRHRDATNVPPDTASVRWTYARLLGLTILNPMTVVYFAALILGLPAIGSRLEEKLAFVVGAFVASLSWQSLLASIGSLFHRRLPPELQVAVGLIGNLVILAFAARIVLDLAGWRL